MTLTHSNTLTLTHSHTHTLTHSHSHTHTHSHTLALDPPTPCTYIQVYDTGAFPFHQAEVAHQFHDDMSAAYGSPYNALRQLALKVCKKRAPA